MTGYIENISGGTHEKMVNRLPPWEGKKFSSVPVVPFVTCKFFFKTLDVYYLFPKNK